MKLRIDPEFSALIPPLHAAERCELESSLRREGCRDPLVLWRGILLDGHNRLEICTRLGLDFKTLGIELSSRQAAKVWIIRNQFGRRNLTPFQKAELALRLEETIQNQARNNIRATQKNEAASAFLKSGKQVHTDKELAKIAGLGHDTIHKARVIAQKAPETVKERLRRGETTIHKQYRRIVYNTEKEFHRSALLESAAHEDRTSVDVRHCSMETLLSGFDEELDAIITDPPYSREHLPLYGDLARLAAKALKPDGILAVMTGQVYLPGLLPLLTPHLTYRWICAYGGSDSQSAQIWPRRIHCRWKPVLLFDRDGTRQWIRDTIMVHDHGGKDLHEWQQSETGMMALVEALTLPGALICDPFCVMGTTGVAALRLGRRFVGL